VKGWNADFEIRFKLAGDGLAGLEGGTAAHLRVEPNSCPEAAALVPKL
jgi:hypothetical protein